MNDICPSPPTLRSLPLTSGLSPTPNNRVCGFVLSALRPNATEIDIIYRSIIFVDVKP